VDAEPEVLSRLILRNVQKSVRRMFKFGKFLKVGYVSRFLLSKVYHTL